MDHRPTWAPARPDPYAITEMPSQDVLEDFLRGLSGPVSVQYDPGRGVFVRVRPRPAPAGPARPALRRVAAGA